MSVKGAVVIGVVVVGLFLAAVVVGGSRDQGGSVESSGLVEWLGGLVGDPSAVPRSAVAAGCVDEDDPDLLVFVGGCSLVVTRDRGLGLLGLEALSPIRVQASAPDGDLEVEDDLAVGEEVRVAVGAGETRVSLLCGAGLGASCQARLTDG